MALALELELGVALLIRLDSGVHPLPVSPRLSRLLIPLMMITLMPIGLKLLFARLVRSCAMLLAFPCRLIRDQIQPVPLRLT